MSGTIERWEAHKTLRDVSDSAPHVQRFKEHLHTVAKWAENYSGFSFRVVTDIRAWADAEVESEEPKFWEAKKAKKTWDGIYPERFKLSDIDLNMYLEGSPLTHREIALVLYRDPLRLPKCSNLLDFENFRLDIYPDKGEPGILLNEYLD